MTVTIKPMETDDEIKGKAYVHWKSWQEAYAGIVDQNYLDSLTLEKCEAVACRWRENILVAKDGEKVVGFAGYGLYRGEEDELKGAGEVFAIYVLSDYYGKGIGYRLMCEAVRRLEGCPKIVVRVLRDNARAIGFYKRFGFDFDGFKEILTLGTPVTAVRMVYDNRPRAGV